MKVGNYPNDEREIRLNLEILCSNCGKRVPGGILTGENFANSLEFKEEIEQIKRSYLCGICRDKFRIKK